MRKYFRTNDRGYSAEVTPSEAPVGIQRTILDWVNSGYSVDIHGGGGNIICSYSGREVPAEGQWEYRVPEEGEWYINGVGHLVQRGPSQMMSTREKWFVITTGHLEGRL